MSPFRRKKVYGGEMEKWARIGLQKPSAKAETCATTFAKPNRQLI
jgi:hypothetical protein